MKSFTAMSYQNTSRLGKVIGAPSSVGPGEWPLETERLDSGTLLPLKDTTAGAQEGEEEEEARDVVPPRPLVSQNEKFTTAPLLDEDMLFRTLSHRQSNVSKVTTGNSLVQSEHDDREIDNLIGTMFGDDHETEGNARHRGVVFTDLTVKGVGVGATLGGTVGSLFYGPFETLYKLMTKGKKAVVSPIRILLHSFNGFVAPKEMCLVLGRPGSGCSTFLKTIANQRSGFKAVEGVVEYGGVSAEKMQKHFRGEIVYNPEDDVHYATLTVQETLKFALKTRMPSKNLRQEDQSREAYVQKFLKNVSRIFWIEHTLGTKVGNEYIQGVSGGERKRVSIAEAMITKASIMVYDNSTRGLDASTAVEYVKSLRAMTNIAKISTFVALYQAGEHLYEAFDKVLLIHEGRCAYFGPGEFAKQYFVDLGFECPPRWTTADFLTSVTDEHERVIRKGYENRFPRTAEELEDKYRKSDFARKVLESIKAIKEDTQQQASSTKRKEKNYEIGFWSQVKACTIRQYQVVWGDKGSVIGKWGGLVFQGLVSGSLFFQLGTDAASTFTKGGTLFLSVLFLSLLALAELTSAFDSRQIMLKHKSYTFYRPSAFAMAQVFADTPLIAIQAIIFDVIIYWMAGLAPTASQFFINLFVLFLTSSTMYAFFRMMGALNSSLDNATRVTGLTLQAVITYTGYLIPTTSMHPWFRWINYINPLGYGFSSLLENEFYNARIECTPPYLVPNGPGYGDPQFQGCSLAGSVPGQTFVAGEAFIEASYDYSRSQLWRNVGIIIGFWIFFVACTVIGTEYQNPNKTGGAVTIFRRGGAPADVTKALDNGQTPRDEEKAQDSGVADVNFQRSEESNEKEKLNKIGKNESIFTWRNVNFYVPYGNGTRQLLTDVQGSVRPGRLTALMGGSGAGKTTLLNVLAQRTRFGKISGEFLVDGRPLPRSFQRSTGFVEQMDVHEPTATVREALQFSALLRQPRETPKQEKLDYVETIISLLEMNSFAEALIGTIGAGLNQEQRKRVTIGVELASKPELLLFLDEPTSGLDSGAAFNVVRFLRKLADAGLSILCTIHQPSSILFENFDELILLKQGGQVVYAGELGNDSQTMIHYFESHKSVSKIPKSANPAEWMLDCIDEHKQKQDWGQLWRESEGRKDQSRELEENIKERSNADATYNVQDKEYASTLMTQTTLVVKRAFVASWRNPEYLIGKFMLHIVTGLFNTFTFYKQENSTIGLQNKLFSVFLVSSQSA